MKRFTDTEKWRDPWFQKLDTQTRTLWTWLCDRVDNAGVIDICWPICNAETNGNFSEESMKLLGEKVERLETGKWWIPKFTLFQFGQLSEDPRHKVHQSIFKLLDNHNLRHRVSHRVMHTPKEKEKDKDKEKEMDIPNLTSKKPIKPKSVFFHEWSVAFQAQFEKPYYPVKFDDSECERLESMPGIK